MSQLIETAFLSAIIVLPVLFIWSHLASRRQSREHHQELLDALAAQQRAALQSMHTLLNERLAPPAPAPAPVVAQPEAVEAKPPAPVKVSEDKLMIIAAVLACQFGKRVKVRSARRVMIGGGANVWSQQGRAAVQASHSMR
jgi:hypothetical protein